MVLGAVITNCAIGTNCVGEISAFSSNVSTGAGRTRQTHSVCCCATNFSRVNFVKFNRTRFTF